MATHQIPILGWNTVPDSSGNVFFEPYDVKATNDVWKHLVLVFADTATRDGAYGVFTVPQNYVGTARIVIQWTSTATTNDVAWDFDYRAVGGDDTESLDQTGTSGDYESLNQNDTAPSATDERMTCTITMDGTKLTAGDTVEFLLARDGTDGGDLMAGPAIVHAVLFQYSDA